MGEAKAAGSGPRREERPWPWLAGQALEHELGGAALGVVGGTEGSRLTGEGAGEGVGVNWRLRLRLRWSFGADDGERRRPHFRPR